MLTASTSRQLQPATLFSKGNGISVLRKVVLPTSYLRGSTHMRYVNRPGNVINLIGSYRNSFVCHGCESQVTCSAAIREGFGSRSFEYKDTKHVCISFAYDSSSEELNKLASWEYVIKHEVL